MSSVFQYCRAPAQVALAAYLCASCATEYRFVSTPEAAAVYQLTPSAKVLLGETPVNFAKTALPTEAPFVVAFEKEGYEAKEVSISPTDNSLTTVAVQLKPTRPGGEDLGLKRTREVLRQVFQIQEQIFQKKYVEALAGLKVLESKEKDLAEVYILRGSVYVLLSDPEQARREWEKALSMDPGLSDIKVSLSKLPKKPVEAKP